MPGWCIDEEADAVEAELDYLYEGIEFMDGPA